MPGTMSNFVAVRTASDWRRRSACATDPPALLCGVLLSWFEVDQFAGPERPEGLRRFLKVLLAS